MKKSTYIIIILIVCGLGNPVFSGNPDQKKEIKNTKEKRASASVNSKDQGWLTKRNFPALQEGPCPFYNSAKPGC
jgi:hypothetical protein